MAQTYVTTLYGVVNTLFYPLTSSYLYLKKYVKKVQPSDTKASFEQTKDSCEQAMDKSLLKDYNGALVDLNVAILARPNDDAAWQWRGIVKYFLKDLEGALLDLGMANKIKPNEALTLRWQGLVQDAMKERKGL